MRRLAWLLPRRLVYWCAIRFMAHAMRVHHDRTPDEIDLLAALRAWDRRAP